MSGVLRPTFSLTIGSLRSTSASPAGGPARMLVQRDMELAADAAQIWLADRSGIGLGDAVTVKFGDGQDGSDEATAFTGEVAEIKPAVEGVTVTALGTMNALLNLHVAAVYESQTAGAVARDLIGQAGLDTGTVDDGPSLPRFAVDARLSGHAHLSRLADRLGFELYANRDGAVMFHALGDAASLGGGGLLGAATGAVSGAAAGLLGGGGSDAYQYGRHLLRARALRRSPRWGTVVVGGESPTSSQGDRASYWLTTDDSSFQGQAGSGEPRRLVLDPVARTKDLADRFAAGYRVVGSRDTQQLAIRVLGRPQLDLGDTVSIAEVPDDLVNGSGYVRAICHRFDPEAGFVTDLCVAVSAAP